jgi:cytohesin
VVKSFLEKDPACIKAKDNNGFLPLHLSTTKDIAQLLLSHGADLEARGYEKRTPLHQAAMRGRMEVVEFLLSQGASVNAVDSRGQTPLLIAIGVDAGTTELAMKNTRHILGLLLAHGADVNFGEGKRTALHKAVSRNRKDLVEVLLDYKANINAKDQYGNTPLHWAVSQKNKHMVELLLERGANVNARNSQRRTPLYDTWGGSTADKEIAEILSRHGGVK